MTSNKNAHTFRHTFFYQPQGWLGNTACSISFPFKWFLNLIGYIFIWGHLRLWKDVWQCNFYTLFLTVNTENSNTLKCYKLLENWLILAALINKCNGIKKNASLVFNSPGHFVYVAVNLWFLSWPKALFLRYFRPAPLDLAYSPWSGPWAFFSNKCNYTFLSPEC